MSNGERDENGMSEDEWARHEREVLEPIRAANRALSDAAWRPFEEEWTGRVGVTYARLRQVRRNRFSRGTPAEADAEADLTDLFPVMAAEAARVANEHDFASRWGCRELEFVLGGGTLFVIFNNNPHDGMFTLRDGQLARFRAWVTGVGGRELAYAEYPDRGEDEGYSYALLVECDAGEDPWAVYYDIIFNSFSTMPPADGDR